MVHALTFHLVTLAPYADQVVALGTTGEVAEQGTFEALNAAGGYVSQFNLPEPDWAFTTNTGEDLAEYKTISTNTKLSTEEIEAKASRQTGDMKIYLYYARSVGWLPFLIFVVAIGAFVFCYSFPSKSSTVQWQLSLPFGRYMGEVVGECQRQEPECAAGTLSQRLRHTGRSFHLGSHFRRLVSQWMSAKRI